MPDSASVSQTRQHTWLCKNPGFVRSGETDKRGENIRARRLLRQLVALSFAELLQCTPVIACKKQPKRNTSRIFEKNKKHFSKKTTVDRISELKQRFP